MRADSTFPNHYMKVNAFDATRGVESLRLSFIVNRPEDEPGFSLVREEGAGRNVRYTLRAYATSGLKVGATERRRMHYGGSKRVNAASRH